MEPENKTAETQPVSQPTAPKGKPSKGKATAEQPAEQPVLAPPVDTDKVSPDERTPLDFSTEALPEKTPELQRVEGVLATMKELTPHYKRTQLVQLLRRNNNPQSPEYRLILQSAKEWGIDLSQ